MANPGEAKVRGARTALNRVNGSVRYGLRDLNKEK
jgi:hypothetical protein